jgi:hypothetical protein
MPSRLHQSVVRNRMWASCQEPQQLIREGGAKAISAAADDRAGREAGVNAAQFKDLQFDKDISKLHPLMENMSCRVSVGGVQGVNGVPCCWLWL